MPGQEPFATVGVGDDPNVRAKRRAVAGPLLADCTLTARIARCALFQGTPDQVRGLHGYPFTVWWTDASDERQHFTISMKGTRLDCALRGERTQGAIYQECRFRISWRDHNGEELTEPLMLPKLLHAAERAAEPTNEGNLG